MDPPFQAVTGAQAAVTNVVTIRLMGAKRSRIVMAEFWIPAMQKRAVHYAVSAFVSSDVGQYRIKPGLSGV
ncbi:hypothetical protein BFF94_001060 [Burkholderia catarinensis]|nr:hypothetical protein BFF94_001060 [Burkholderia catarinensis]